MKIMIVKLLLIMCLSAGADHEALFKSFSYAGTDTMYEKDLDRSSQYINPILTGFFPDPSICRKGDDYFLVTSTFSYYPGVPIFHSKDLVNWTQLGFVLNRPSQLRLDGIRLSGGVYAPAISYNPHNDTFYMVNTIVDGIGNFYVKTKDPFSGEWSEPVTLPAVHGIDPSFLFDEDGKAYVVYNGDCPGTPQWDGHRAIWCYEFDWENDCVKGENTLLVDGGVNPADKPVWIEGPHVYNVDGKYYLMCAEGGTGPWHSEVIFTSDSPMGPYVPHKNNPILTQRTLPENRTDKITSTGHADLIQTSQGDWWAVFLGCRPYEGNFYNTGRETFLLPVEWQDGAPVILPESEQVPLVVAKSELGEDMSDGHRGNFSWTDDFSTLDHKWLQVRTPIDEWWRLDGGLRLKTVDRSLNENGANPAFMAVRQQHMTCQAETVMEFMPEADELAGLAVFQNEQNNYVLGKQITDGVPSVVLYRADKEEGRTVVACEPLSASQNKKPVRFRVIADGPDYIFEFAVGNSRKWTQMGGIQNGRNLSTDYAGGFTGAVIGCYATSVR